MLHKLGQKYFLVGVREPILRKHASNIIIKLHDNVDVVLFHKFNTLLVHYITKINMHPNFVHLELLKKSNFFLDHLFRTENTHVDLAIIGLSVD
jgi:hypothetical protein